MTTSNSSLADSLSSAPQANDAARLRLTDGASVAVVGGGPAGSFFSYFILEMTKRLGMEVQVSVYEPRDFSVPGPTGCNMCGGVVSESLVQVLATEGINLPPTVVQRGIASYMLHTDVGSVRIETPRNEKRIAAVHRGAGPRDIKQLTWTSFDAYLQELALANNVHLIRDRVDEVACVDGRPQVKTRLGARETYDLVAIAVGVNSPTLKGFQSPAPNFKPPQTTKTFICEYALGREAIAQYLGDSMHVFLLNIPRLEFAAVIPKGDYVSVCLLGEEIDAPMIKTFFASPVVKSCFPAEMSFEPPSCHCAPRINTAAAVQPFADRMVFIGDSGVTRLYKDGIGGAYRTAKAAATTAVFHGISAEDFRRHYWPTCHRIDTDNKLGKLIFAVARQGQKRPYSVRGILDMVSGEQNDKQREARMSMVLWDLFTGSAPYREILRRAIHPAFLARFVWSVIAANLPGLNGKTLKRAT